MSYDLLGRKTAMSDPNKGAWNYEYNGFGELTKQTDAKGQTSGMTYDGLGRMATRARGEVSRRGSSLAFCLLGLVI